MSEHEPNRQLFTTPDEVHGGGRVKSATLFRIVKDNEACPEGEEALQALLDQGYAVEDFWLKTNEDVDAFKSMTNAETTPQAFVGGERIGGLQAITEGAQNG